jgi:uncharacterized protein (TIGR03067 family)
MPRIICVLVLLTTPLPLAAGDDEARKELKALEGKWKAVSLEAGGKVFAKEAVPDFTFIIGEQGKAIGHMPLGEYQATITVDPRKSPKTMDNRHESGADKGKKQYGIYRLEGDKLTVCMTRPGAAATDRPKDFNSKGSTGVVFVFERIKENKKP